MTSVVGVPSFVGMVSVVGGGGSQMPLVILGGGATGSSVSASVAGGGVKLAALEGGVGWGGVSVVATGGGRITGSRFLDSY